MILNATSFDFQKCIFASANEILIQNLKTVERCSDTFFVAPKITFEEEMTPEDFNDCTLTGNVYIIATGEVYTNNEDL